jgi:hypothetical protein
MLVQQDRIVPKKNSKDNGTAIEATGSKQTEAIVCTEWYIVTTYHYADGSTYVTEEYVGTTCEDDGRCKFEPQAIKGNEADFAVVVMCGGGDTGTDNPETAPGDDLCINTFQNFYGGQTSSFWGLNVTGITFENGRYANRFDAGYNLANGITDLMMNFWQTNSSMGYQGTALGYLQDTFPALFSGGDIYSK